jgi:hypothetical protein
VTKRIALRNFCTFIQEISINTLRSIGKGKQDMWMQIVEQSIGVNNLIYYSYKIRRTTDNRFLCSFERANGRFCLPLIL